MDVRTSWTPPEVTPLNRNYKGMVIAFKPDGIEVWTDMPIVLASEPQELVFFDFPSAGLIDFRATPIDAADDPGEPAFTSLNLAFEPLGPPGGFTAEVI